MYGTKLNIRSWLERLPRPLSGASAFLLASLALIPQVRAEEPAVSAETEVDPSSTWFWVDANGGADFVSLRTFNADVDELTLDLLPSSAIGPQLGLGVGARLLFLTLGVRGRGASFSGSNSGALGTDGWWLWRVGPEIGARVPLGKVEPHFALGGGYAAIGGTKQVIDGLKEGLDIDGGYASATAGVDYFFNELFSLGGRLDGNMLMMARRGMPVRDLLEPQKVDTLNELEARVLEADGSSVGWSLGFSILAGLHI